MAKTEPIETDIIGKDKLTPVLKKTGKNINTFSTQGTKDLSTLGKGFTALKGLVAGFAIFAGSQLLSFGAKIAETGAKLQSMKTSLENMTGSSKQLIDSLRNSTQGMVSEFDLVQNSIQAMNLGIDQNKLPEMFRQAIILGKAAGRTATEAIQDITTGIGRQSPLILDNLGIKVKMAEAEENLAKSLGKTVEQLTLQEKQTAFATEAFRALNEKAENFGGKILPDANTEMEKFKTHIKDLTTDIGEGLSESVGELAGNINLVIETFQTFKELKELDSKANIEQKNSMLESLPIFQLLSDGYNKLNGDLERFKDGLELINKVTRENKRLIEEQTLQMSLEDEQVLEDVKNKTKQKTLFHDLINARINSINQIKNMTQAVIKQTQAEQGLNEQLFRQYELQRKLAGFGGSRPGGAAGRQAIAEGAKGVEFGFEIIDGKRVNTVKELNTVYNPGGKPTGNIK